MHEYSWRGEQEFDEDRSEELDYGREDKVAPHIASEKMKSNSLDDLRQLREGLVANTKAAFSPAKELGKQVSLTTYHCGYVKQANYYVCIYTGEPETENM